MFDRDGADIGLTWANALDHERIQFRNQARNMLATLRKAGFQVTANAQLRRSAPDDPGRCTG
jgi:hypothetical protein